MTSFMDDSLVLRKGTVHDRLPVLRALRHLKCKQKAYGDTSCSHLALEHTRSSSTIHCSLVFLSQIVKWVFRRTGKHMFDRKQGF